MVVVAVLACAAVLAALVSLLSMLFSSSPGEPERSQRPMVKSCSIPGVTLAMNFRKTTRY